MSTKYSTIVTREDLPAFFRSLAESIESGESCEGFPPMSEFTKFAIKVKDEFGQVVVKMKVKTDNLDFDEEACQCGGITQDGKPKYSSLKKRMKTSWRAVYRSVHANELPVEAAMVSFIEDSRLMTQYPGYGDEFYPAYDAAVDELEKAWNDKNITAMHTAVDAINHLYTDCHHRYK